MKKVITKKGLTLWINEAPAFNRKVVTLPIERDPYEVTKEQIDKWIKEKEKQMMDQSWELTLNLEREYYRQIKGTNEPT
jgi:hypothetical protein